jgi:hypothetical protein
MLKIPLDAPGTHHRDSFPALRTQHVEIFDRELALQEIAGHVLPALHVAGVAHPLVRIKLFSIVPALTQAWCQGSVVSTAISCWIW